MSDEIFQGQFVYAKQKPAWHRKGVELQGTEDVDKAMEMAGIDGWNVKCLPLNTLVPDFVDSGLNVVVRWDKEEQRLRVASDQLVGESYTPIQNEVVFKDMIEFLAGMGFPVDAMGVLGRLGNRAFVTFDAGKTLVHGNERYYRYLVAIADHSGRGAVRIMTVSFRVVCANTEHMAIQASNRDGTMIAIQHNQYSLEHFWSNGDANRLIVGSLGIYQQNLEQMAASLQQTTFTDADWKKFVSVYTDTFLKPETDRQARHRDAMNDKLNLAWNLESKRAEALQQDGTSLWTAKQAISTYVQHLSSERRGLARSMVMMEGRTPPILRAMYFSLDHSLGEDRQLPRVWM